MFRVAVLCAALGSVVTLLAGEQFPRCVVWGEPHVKSEVGAPDDAKRISVTDMAKDEYPSRTVSWSRYQVSQKFNCVASLREHSGRPDNGRLFTVHFIRELNANVGTPAASDIIGGCLSKILDSQPYLLSQTIRRRDGAPASFGNPDVSAQLGTAGGMLAKRDQPKPNGDYGQQKCRDGGNVRIFFDDIHGHATSISCRDADDLADTLWRSMGLLIWLGCVGWAYARIKGPR